MQLQSTITCPHYGYAALETMPTDACKFFYDCRGLRTTAEAGTGRLLRVLFLRLRAVSACSDRRALLRLIARLPIIS